MIIFESVTKRFGDDAIALEDVSFEIEEGELVVITGHSGSGKTTLMRLLTKEYLPTEGEIYFNGNPLSQIKSGKVPQHRRQLGIVFQDYKLLPELNVWENIALALNIMGKKQEEIEARVTDLLRLVDLVDKAFLFPSQLSGGEAQRVSIARALASAPVVIFADEPTGNLDPETSVTVARLLEKINDLGTTVIITTHDISVMDILTKERHIKLDKGKVVGDSGTNATHKKTKTSKTNTETDHTSKKAPETSVEELDTPPQTVETSSAKKPTKTESEAKSKNKRSLGLPKVSLPFGRKSKTESFSSESTDKADDEPKKPLPPNGLKTEEEKEPVSVKVESL